MCIIQWSEKCIQGFRYKRVWGLTSTLMLTNLLAHNHFKIGLFIVLALVCFVQLIGLPIALLVGIVVGNLIGNPFPQRTGKWSGQVMKYSIVLLGLGINIPVVLSAGADGLWISSISLVITLAAGFALTRLLKTDAKTSYLITCGTAICGGSAIATVSPIVKAEDQKIAVAMSTIFILNTVALFFFPLVGQALGICSSQFGLWAAMAIHDTSSVIGATAGYGQEALEVGTTVKLVRSLWIIPIALITMLLTQEKDSKIAYPYFILFFFVAVCIGSFFPLPEVAISAASSLAKGGLTLAMFMIGMGITYGKVKNAGMRPMVMGTLLWIVVSVTSLLCIFLWAC